MASLAGKSYLVTGSTDGIGRHTAERLYRAGAHVMVHGRNAARVKDAVESIVSINSNGTVTSFVADLSDFSEVRRFAAEVKHSLLASETHQLTCLINNAGVYEKQKSIATSSGLEMTWAVNVAAPYLLTSLLLDSISERIVNVASVSASNSIDFNNLQQEKGYSSHNAYSLSKLADIMFSVELAERLATSGRSITSNSLDPGTVNTKMLYAGWGAIGMRVQDADDQFFLATDSSVSEVNGKYFISSRERKAPSPAYDEAARRRLWDILQDQTGAEWSI